jgi:N-acetylglucosaminyldiphosphoundecaprenol N-acetyl-beta-D-mannosaminyltransferase
MTGPSWVWGLPLSPLTLAQVADEARALVEARRPSFFITANVHYAMLSHEMPGLRDVNARASFLVADGAPLVWASRWKGRPLPERVAGSDLIFVLSEMAAQRGYRVFFLGGAEGVADEAARRLAGRYPGLRVVGTESPPYRDPTPEEHDRLIERVRAASPDILIVASTMPKGELWIATNYERLGVPLCVNLGAGIDFAAGRIRRAPRRLQVLGLEWAFRLWMEPGRLYSRYARNARFALSMIARDLLGRRAEGLASTDG